MKHTASLIPASHVCSNSAPYPLGSSLCHQISTSSIHLWLCGSSSSSICGPSTACLLPAFSPSIPSCSTAPSAFRLRTRAMGADLLGDFGARDPFPAELESQFGEKVLGNKDTEHKILIPNRSALSLAQQQCSPVLPLQPPMSEDDAKKLLKEFEDKTSAKRMRSGAGMNVRGRDY